jgi:hypothetical protein
MPKKTHPLPVQEETERRRRSYVILTGNRPAHAHSEVDLRKRDVTRGPPPGLSMRDILEHRLDHPARPTRRGREHGDDGAVRLEQAAERRRVRRDVDCARDSAARWRTVPRIPSRSAICDALEEGRCGPGAGLLARGGGRRETGRATEHGVYGGAQRSAKRCREEVGGQV